jgi:transposase
VFLHTINREVPAGLDVHVVLDNLSAHKTPAMHEWLLRHKRFHLHFTPTDGSWMNVVERWFSALTTNKLQRSAHRTVNDLTAIFAAGPRPGTTTPNRLRGPHLSHSLCEL